MLTTRALLRPLFRAFTNANKPNKDFDFSAFEEEIRAQRARSRNEQAFRQHQESGGSASDFQGGGAGPSKITLSPLVAKDLQLLNVPKYVSRDELKKQYHKLAKIYHPDIVQSKNLKSSQLLSDQ
jgi:DnaJ-domain-containing protein 1